jgi:hypothetical protein
MIGSCAHMMMCSWVRMMMCFQVADDDLLLIADVMCSGGRMWWMADALGIRRKQEPRKVEEGEGPPDRLTDCPSMRLALLGGLGGYDSISTEKALYPLLALVLSFSGLIFPLISNASSSSLFLSLIRSSLQGVW